MANVGQGFDVAFTMPASIQAETAPAASKVVARVSGQSPALHLNVAAQHLVDRKPVPIWAAPQHSWDPPLGLQLSAGEPTPPSNLICSKRLVENLVGSGRANCTVATESRADEEKTTRYPPEQDHGVLGNIYQGQM